MASYTRQCIPYPVLKQPHDTLSARVAYRHTHTHTQMGTLRVTYAHTHPHHTHTNTHLSQLPLPPDHANGAPHECAGRLHAAVGAVCVHHAGGGRPDLQSAAHRQVVPTTGWHLAGAGAGGRACESRYRVGCTCAGLARTIFICGVYTVLLAGKSPNIRYYTVHIHGSGQPCACACWC